MTKLPPPNLPDFIFLLSDHTTRPLACDVAKKLSENSDTVRGEDFLYPIHEAIQMWSHDDDWRKDWGDPRQVSSELRDQITSLEKWFNDYHGEAKLGQMTWSECQELLVDVVRVYRDASWTHIKPFLENLKPHQYLIVDLLPINAMDTMILHKRFQFADPTVDSVVAEILKASR